MFLRNLSKFLLLIVWVALLVIQMIYFVPYKRTYLRLSDDGVSHSTITGNGYASLLEIEESFKVNEKDGKVAYCKTIDTPQLAINLSLTTIVVGAMYFLFIFKKENSYKNIKKQKINEVPYLNFDKLAFADEETQIQIQKDYAEAMYRYVKSKIDNE